MVARKKRLRYHISITSARIFWNNIRIFTILFRNASFAGRFPCSSMPISILTPSGTMPG